MDVTHAGSVAVKAARVSVLKVSLGRLRWVPCAIRVDEPTNSLVLFDSKGKNVFPPTPLSGRGAGAVRFSKRAAVGQPNAIVVCDGARRMSEAVAAMRAAERRRPSSGEEGNDGNGGGDGGDGEDVCLDASPPWPGRRGSSGSGPRSRARGGGTSSTTPRREPVNKAEFTLRADRFAG